MPLWAKSVLIVCLLFFSGCSLKSLLPPSLAVVGGGVGAISGNPAIAAVSAGAGAAAGHLIIMDEDKRVQQQQVIDALTTGDANALIDAKLDEAKNNGFFDGVLTEVYGVLKLCVIGLALWILVPMIYSHWRAKRTEEKWKTD